MYGIRPATGEDAHYILDMDIKCFDDPWPAEQWREVQANIVVATYYGTPIGMVVSDSNRLIKLAVKPAFRNRGIGAALLATVEEFGRQQGVTDIQTVVPESLRGVIDWLSKAGFRAVGIEGEFKSYGNTEHGYLLRKPLCE